METKRATRIYGAQLSQSDRSWARGTSSEAAPSALVVRRFSGEARVLHDLRGPGRRGRIDHVAVSPGGIWVFEARRHPGRIEVRKAFRGQAVLRVGENDETGLVHDVRDWVLAVQGVLGLDLPVRGALCFVDGVLPLLGTPQVDDVLVLSPRGLADRINARSVLAPEDVGPLARQLQRALG